MSGIRAKILAVLKANHELTIEELKEQLPEFTGKQMFDNVSQAKREGLLTSRLDDGKATYKITALGISRITDKSSCKLPASNNEAKKPDTDIPVPASTKPVALTEEIVPAVAPYNAPEHIAPMLNKPTAPHDFLCSYDTDGRLGISKGSNCVELEANEAAVLMRFVAHQLNYRAEAGL